MEIKSPMGSMQLNTGMVSSNEDQKIARPSCESHDQVKAFIVTDDEDLKGMLKYALDSYDLQVLFCQGRAGALAPSAIDPFDYIIVDCDAPGMDGIDRVKQLREQFTCSIMISLSREDRGVAHLQAGMNDFLQKPFVPYRLAMMLDGGDILA